MSNADQDRADLTGYPTAERRRQDIQLVGHTMAFAAYLIELAAGKGSGDTYGGEVMRQIAAATAAMLRSLDPADLMLVVNHGDDRPAALYPNKKEPG